MFDDLYEELKAVYFDWANQGIGRDARYMVIMSDIITEEERPLFIFQEQDVRKELKKYYEDPIYDVVCIIDLKQNIDKQIKAIHTPKVRVYNGMYN